LALRAPFCARTVSSSESTLLFSTPASYSLTCHERTSAALFWISPILSYISFSSFRRIVSLLSWFCCEDDFSWMICFLYWFFFSSSA
jgi:hypothetical protein